MMTYSHGDEIVTHQIVEIECREQVGHCDGSLDPEESPCSGRQG
jgi:hypothetical protein